MNASGCPRWFERCGSDVYRVKGRIFLEKMYAVENVVPYHPDIFLKTGLMESMMMLAPEATAFAPSRNPFLWGRTPARNLLKYYFEDANTDVTDVAILLTSG